MSQDLRRERAGAHFDTIAGATNYIAQLESENAGLRRVLKYVAKFSDLPKDVDEVVRITLEGRDA